MVGRSLKWSLETEPPVSFYYRVPSFTEVLFVVFNDKDFKLPVGSGVFKGIFDIKRNQSRLTRKHFRSKRNLGCGRL